MAGVLWQEDESSKDVASDLLPYPYADSPFMAKILGDEFNVLTKYRARRQGVYDECCLKACTRNELLSYCS
ncbi:unnamed protein product [Ceratitis capitata]|uniref:(Mediterranean fruit fly) hypothetical protein n=1 Tax=Ceratitis capitata TaxID=7213 RepID=A0A811UXQ3_CERCA|nr:unnamed protein product [Ceratitis capitata]